jgi:hypothetical protein
MTDPRIDELDRQFNAPGSTMRLDDYQLKRAQILSTPAPKVEADTQKVERVTTAPASRPADENSAVTWRGLQKILDVIVGATKLRDTRHKELEARIVALEARPHALAYGGVWQSGQESKAGWFYTDRGSCWFCKQSTTDRPGESDAFVLAVKAGRDAR